MQHDPLYLPTLSSCNKFLFTIVGLFLESHIKDVGEIFDDMRLLFEANSIATVIDSCTLAL